MSGFSRAFVVVNTRSGGHDEERIRRALEGSLGAAGVAWEWALREKGQSRRDLTRQAIADGCDLIVAAGGDGTVAKCADQVSQSDAVLGILPTGTGNLLARELGVPMELDEAARTLVEGRLRAIDGMEVNGKRRCFSHVSLGTYSRIASMDTPEDKKTWGRFAYLRLLLKEVGAGKSWRFRLEHDGRQRRVRASLILAANIGATGLPGLQWRQDARPDDGVIDVCIVRARTPGEYLQLLGDAWMGRHREHEAMEYLEVRERLVVATGDGMPVRGDGKEIGEGEAAIEVIPRAVKVLVPGG